MTGFFGVQGGRHSVGDAAGASSLWPHLLCQHRTHLLFPVIPAYWISGIISKLDQTGQEALKGADGEMK